MASTSLLNLLQWSETDMTMEQFVDWFKQFPADDCGKLCATTTGYLGCDQMSEIGGGELYWVREIQRQKRVVVQDTKRCYLSIPINYGRKFVVMYENSRTYDKKKMTLQQVLDVIADNSVNIQCLMVENNEKVSFNVGPDAGNTVQLGQLEFVDIYEEKYLVAYNIHSDGREMHTRAAPIPVYMPITLDYAVGFQSPEIKQHFDIWIENVRQKVSTIPQQPVSFSAEIMKLSDKPICGHYEYIKPETFVFNKSTDDDDYEEISDPHQSKSIGSYVVMLPTSQQPKHVASPSTPKAAAGFATALPSGQETIALPPVPARPSHSRRFNVPLPPNQAPNIPLRPPPKVRSGSLPLPSPDADSLRLQRTESERRPPPTLPKSSKQADTNLKSGTARGRIGYEELNWTNADEVPVDLDIASLSINDVADCLRLLKLDAYTQILEDNDVDGKLLLCLDDDMLIKHFGFKKFDAMKLMKFIKEGWRPR